MNLNTIRKSLAEIERQMALLSEELERAKTERDEFSVLVFQSRKSFAAALYNANKSGKKIEMVVRDTYYKATALGFRGSAQEWRNVLGAWCAPKE